MKRKLLITLMLSPLMVPPAFAAISLDRTRVIYNGDQKSVSMNISNENKRLPYLAQAWIEDEKGKKLSTPLAVLPPVQRIEADGHSQIKIQSLGAEKVMPQDRESLYYFNLREIPPRSDKPNTLQIALQTRIKLFYRPSSLYWDSATPPWQEKLTLTRSGDSYQVNNPTPYYVTLVDGSSSVKGASVKGFEAVMIEPKGKAMLTASASALGNSPVLTYINDFGGRPQLQFTCQGVTCQAKPVPQGK